MRKSFVFFAPLAYFVESAFGGGQYIVSKIEWVKWQLNYGNPRTRASQIKRFLAFEVYRLGCRLSGYKVTHWLDKKHLLAGKYLLIEARVPFGVQMLDKIFPFGKEAHTDYVPFSPSLAEELRQAGKSVIVREIQYQLIIEST